MTTLETTFRRQSVDALAVYLRAREVRPPQTASDGATVPPECIVKPEPPPIHRTPCACGCGRFLSMTQVRRAVSSGRPNWGKYYSQQCHVRHMKELQKTKP